MTGAQLRRIIMLMAGLIGIVVISATALKQCSAPKPNIDTSTNPGDRRSPSSSNEGGDSRVAMPSVPSNPTSVDPNYTERSPVTEWDNHAMVMQQENFIPIGEAFYTDFMTLYHIPDDGYIPSQPMGPVNKTGTCYQQFYAPDESSGNNNTVSERSIAAVADSATVSGSSRNIYQALFGCPRDLGNVEAGSYVFDIDGNDLAGFDFDYPAQAFEVLSQGGDRYIVFPQGGSVSGDDPAIRQLRLRKLLVEAKPDASKKDRKKTAEELQALVHARGVVSDIEYLPLRSDHGSDEEFDDAYVQAIQNEIDALIKRRGKDPQNRDPDAFDNIFIHLRSPAYSSEELMKQQRRRAAKLKERIDEIKRNIDASVNTSIKTLSFGDELPMCADTGPACWSANRSATIYTR